MKLPKSEQELVEKAKRELEQPESISQRQQSTNYVIVAFGHAIERGYEHYDIYGKPLNTIKECVEALLRDGMLVIEKPNAPPIMAG